MRISRRAIVLAALILLAGWQAAAMALNTMALPEPWRVFVLLGRRLSDGSLAGHLFISLVRALLGILLALVAAVPLGLLAGTESWWDRRLSPFIYLLYPIPHVVLLPLVIILFGIGDLSKIVLIGLIVFFQILVTSRDAARAIHPNYLLTMRTLGASRAQIYGHVIWPATLPRILTALRISIGTAVAILFFVESFATNRGLGFVIMDAWGLADYERLYAGIVAMAALGLSLYLLLDAVEERVCRWTRTA
ncbi:MAG: ABC transporter permease [Desulfobulbus sp.]|jgi:NitT/TauT family transport system permease protein|nr:ABC transporter permease [Desulfobulbus sp.]